MKRQGTLAVRHIWQLDNHHFAIEWVDGVAQQWSLADLQRACPCAACVDEGTGQRTNDPTAIADDLRAEKIVSVGRYALRIHFRVGCSNGIFHFDELRNCGQPLQETE